MKKTGWVLFGAVVMTGILLALPNQQKQTTTQPSAEVAGIIDDLKNSGPGYLVRMNNDDVFAVRQVIISENVISLVIPQRRNTVVHWNITELAPHVKRVAGPDGGRIVYAILAKEYIRRSADLPATTVPVQ